MNKELVEKNNYQRSHSVKNRIKIDLEIVILAAGHGSRMLSTIPKPMHKIANKEMLWYNLELSRKLRNMIINVSENAYSIEKNINVTNSVNNSINNNSVNNSISADRDRYIGNSDNSINIDEGGTCSTYIDSSIINLREYNKNNILNTYDTELVLSTKNIVLVLNDEIAKFSLIKEWQKEYNFHIVIQKDINGTGSAVECAFHYLQSLKAINESTPIDITLNTDKNIASNINKTKLCLVLYADTPFIECNTIRDLIIKYYQTDRQMHMKVASDTLNTLHNSYVSNKLEDITLLNTKPFDKNTVTNLETKAYKNKQCKCVMLGFYPNDIRGYGALILSENNKDVIDSVVPYSDIQNTQKNVNLNHNHNSHYINDQIGDVTTHLCNSGIILADYELLNQFLYQKKSKKNKVNNAAHDTQNTTITEFYLTDFAKFVGYNGYICTYIVADSTLCLGINDNYQKALAEQIIQNKIRHKMLLNGVTMIAPETVYFSFDTKICSDVTIQPNVYFGENVKIGTGSSILAFSHIVDAHIGENVIVGPFARIRNNTKINHYSRIGNFVEVKNANIHHNVKALHHSYLGDVNIDDDVNIGAGTIICNYDGINKHRTTIKSRSFIGGNATLISPRVIGEDSIVGAGSVIVEDVPQNALAIGRARQINLGNRAKMIIEAKKCNQNS